MKSVFLNEKLKEEVYFYVEQSPSFIIEDHEKPKYIDRLEKALHEEAS